MKSHASLDTVVYTLRVGGRVVRLVVPKKYDWPHQISTEQSVGWYR
jgi:hypothetical protein